MVSGIELRWLFKLRVVVARCGEMDLGRWWNTNRQLGAAGASVLRRGFPRTYHFAQARSVIAVAGNRCGQVFAPPSGFVTLWRLTEDYEDALDANWESWLEDPSSWSSFFEQVAAIASPDLAAALRHLELVAGDQAALLHGVKPTADGRALLVPALFPSGREVLAQLALGFAKAPMGSPVVPYARAAG